MLTGSWRISIPAPQLSTRKPYLSPHSWRTLLRIWDLQQFRSVLTTMELDTPMMWCDFPTWSEYGLGNLVFGKLYSSNAIVNRLQSWNKLLLTTCYVLCSQLPFGGIKKSGFENLVRRGLTGLVWQSCLSSWVSHGVICYTATLLQLTTLCDDKSVELRQES